MTLNRPNDFMLDSKEIKDARGSFGSVKDRLSDFDDKIGVLSRKTNWIDVRDYGAKGDGVTDDTQAILDALNDCENGKVNYVYFPAKHVFTGVRMGSFSGIANPRNVPTIPAVDNIVLFGQYGFSEIILKAESNVDVFVFRNASNIAFKDLIINGNSTNQTGSGGWGGYWDNLLCGVLARDGVNFVMQNCEIKNVSWGCINVSSVFEDVHIHDSKFDNAINGINVSINYGSIKNNIVRNCPTGSGIYIEGNNSDANYGVTNADVTVESNKVYNCSKGIQLQNMVFNTIVKSNIVADSSNGIFVNGSGLTAPRKQFNIIVESNIIRKCLTNEGYGIYATGVEKLSIGSNMVSECVIGIRLYGVNNPSIFANDVSKCNDDGIALLGSSTDASIIGNRSYNNCQAGTAEGSGLFLQGGGGHIVQGNFLYDNQTTKTQKFGIHFDNCTNVVVTYNSIKGNANRVGLVEGTSTYHMRHNILDGSVQYLASTNTIVSDIVPASTTGINVVVSSGLTSLAVTGLTEVNATYKVNVTPAWNTTCWLTGKTTTGFTINFGTAPASASTLDWSVSR